MDGSREKQSPAAAGLIDCDRSPARRMSFHWLRLWGFGLIEIEIERPDLDPDFDLDHSDMNRAGPIRILCLFAGAKRREKVGATPG